MRFIVVATLKDSIPSEEFTPELMQAEAKAAMTLWSKDIIRDLYTRTDGKGAVLIVEADSEEDLKEKLDLLPLVNKGMLTRQIIGITAYRAIKQMAES